jgi:predicted HTH transcriptional regulator
MGLLVIPRSVNDWTFDFIESLVDANYFETDSLDFKEYLVNRRNPSHRERVQKSACAFANSKGGFLVFGVADRDSVKIGRSRIVGIDRADSGRLFGEQLNGIQPNIQYTFQNPPISVPNEHNKVIFIVYIPRSSESPHTFGQDGKFLFYKRTNKVNVSKTTIFDPPLTTYFDPPG